MVDENKTKESTFGPYDRNAPPPLDFETWAELGAQLFERDAPIQIAILTDRRIEPGLWDACNTFWTMELADQIQRGNLRLARRYGKICVLEMQRRRESGERPESPAPSAAGSVDETAFLLALPDETALPFERPHRLDALAALPELPLPPESDRASSTEETQLVPAVKSTDHTLPFHKPDDRGGSKPR